MFPNDIAIEAGQSRVSYGELLLNARRFASILKDLDINVGDRVVLCIENSAEYVQALLGSWLAGAVACPVNAQARPREILHVLDHAAASLIVIDSTNLHFRKIVSDGDTPVIMVPRSALRLPSGVLDWRMVENAEPCTDIKINEDMHALVMYTSGTTGSPKGVLLTHKNVSSNVNAIVDYLNLTRLDRVCAILPFHYSYGLSVLLTHLAVGGTLVLGPSMVYPQEVVNCIRNSDISGFSGVASSFAILLQRTNFAQNPGKLRYVTQAGGPMRQTLTESLLAALGPETQLFIMYGQTEATARLTYLPPELIGKKLGSAGRALSGVDVKIVGEAGEDLPSGIRGHVIARGDNIMVGYWRNAAATSAVLKDGWLYTGDLGYMDSEGFLFLEGRHSDMIKTGAHRVSPEEVEEVACEVSGVYEAAAVGTADDLLGQIIVLYLIGDGAEETEQKVIRHCREHLAAHKVPRTICWRSSFPRTESGKIQRFKLAQALNKDGP